LERISLLSPLESLLILSLLLIMHLVYFLTKIFINLLHSNKYLNDAMKNIIEKTIWLLQEMYIGFKGYFCDNYGNKIDQHWSTDLLYVDPKYLELCQIICSIKFAFHLEDNNLFKSETFGKLHSIIETLNLKFKYPFSKNYNPWNYDFISWESRICLYMPCKSTKTCIKIFCLCELLSI